MNHVNWGIIGCGDVTEKKSGQAFNKVADSRLVAVMRRDADKAADYAQRHNVAHYYSNADQLINDPQVNAIYIATPPGSHADYTLKAAAAGKPVYVEKPMARTHAECQAMVDACQAAGVPLYVAYYRRALPAFLKVKALVEEGAIGEIRYAQINLVSPPKANDADPQKRNWRVVSEQSGGGYFFDLASHQLDYLDYLFGPIHTVAGRAVNQAGLYDPEDLVSAHFSFANGIVGTGLWCFTAAPCATQETIELIGSLGTITFSAFAFGAVVLNTAAGTKEFPFEPPEHVQQPLIQTVVDDLLGRGTCPSTGVSAARTSRVIDQIVHPAE